MVILFDGVCNLCNAFVRFVIKWDKNKIFQFASLQSNYSKGLSINFKLPIAMPETIVLFDGKTILSESDAVIKIVSSLGGVWKCAVILSLVPRFIRNWFYRIVAQNRYKVFGKRDQCMVPDENVKDRFIDNIIFAPNSFTNFL